MIDTLVVMAKECRPGHVKTRLTPPFSPREAAEIAAASLADTLAFGAALPARRRVISYDGAVPPPGAAAYEIHPQVGDGLDERIAAALDRAHGLTLLIGMDTPQLRPADIAPVVDDREDLDGWFGPADDGGFWALALRAPRGDLVRGIPMSRDDTGRRQLARLHAAGLRIGMLGALTDIDDDASLDDVVRGAADDAVPHLRRTLHRLGAAATADEEGTAR